MSENKANIGPRIVLEGEAEYKQSILSVNKSMNVLKSELKAVSAEYESNVNSIDALRSKNDILTKQQTEQEKKLQLLRGALDDANKKYGEGSKQVQEWQIKTNNAYVELNKINRELVQNEKYMKEAEESTDKTAKSIDEFGNKVKEVEKKTSTFGDVLKANLSSQAIISGIETLINGMQEIVTSTEEFRSDFSKLATNADAAGASITDVSTQLKGLDAITKETDSNIEALSNLLQAGFTGSSLVQVVEELSGAIIKFPDTLKIESLSDALQETLATGKATGQFGELLERLGYNLDVFNKQMDKTNSNADRQQVILDTLASTGLRNVNEEYIKNNQTMIEYANAQYELREVMSEIAISITPLLSKSMKTLTDNIGDITNDILPVMINGFTWMVDNSDRIEAGLKGIGAALIAKKSADGVLFVINAYKTFTTTAEAATTAQVAFNTATKANAIGAIVSVVAGLSVALYSYAKNAKEAANSTSELSDKIRDGIEERKRSSDSILAEVGAIKKLSDNLYDLAEKEKKTTAEKKQMNAIAQQLNEQMPNLNIAINEQTGLLSKQREEVENLTDALLEQYKVQAAKDSLESTGRDIYAEEENLKSLEEERLEILTKIEARRKDTSGIYNSMDVTRYRREIRELEDSLVSQESKIEAAKENIKELGEEWNEAIKYIGDHSAIDASANSLDNFLKKYKDTLDSQNKSYAEGLEDRIDAIKDTYDDSEKALDRSLKSERKALQKAQKEQIEIIEDASEEELEILETNHKKKLKLIDEEYLEKMRLVDEDRYNEIKKVQDQIDAMDSQTKAEDRARELKEEADKRAELRVQIDTAKTAEERLRAQQELVDFEEETAQKRIRTERELQKDILNEQKETINASYDAKIKALEDEQKEVEKKANKTYEDDQKGIAKRLEKKKQELSDIHELETEAFDERLDTAKDSLDKQKEHAIKRARETYEEDLAEFKLNNALKYDEAVANHDAIKKYISESALSNSGNFEAAQKNFLNTNIWDRDYTFGNNSRLAQNKQTLSIDYSQIEDSMVSALGKMKLDVVLDGKKVGTLVEKRVNNMIR